MLEHRFGNPSMGHFNQHVRSMGKDCRSSLRFLRGAVDGGGVIGPVTIGSVAKHINLNAGMATLAVAPLIAVILLTRLPRQSSHADAALTPAQRR